MSRTRTGKRTDWTLMTACAVTILFVGSGCRAFEGSLAGARSPQEIAQATADFYVQDVRDDSCAVAIVGADETVFACAGAATRHSLFRIASLSKFFLHVVIRNLVAEGRLDLSQSVASCSTMDLPPEYEQITLQDLLQNHSGLPREFIVGWNPADTWTALSCGFVGTDIYGGFETRDDFARMTWRSRWRQAVRTRHEVYSNMGFGLLGATLEDTLGMPLEDLLRAELTGPRRLSDTAYVPRGDQTNRVTRACAGQLPWLVRRGQPIPEHRLGAALRATGGLFSSISDCAALFAAYWPIVDEQLAERSVEACSDEAVFGLLRVKDLPDGSRVLYRAGMIYGGASFVGFDFQTRTIVIILRNVTSWPDQYGFAVMERLRNPRFSTRTCLSTNQHE